MEGAPIIQKIAIPATKEKFPVESLHYIKMAMDDLIKNPERFGIGSSEAAAIGKTQGTFVKWIGNNSDAYNKAREAYKAASVPINQMQVGQDLGKKLANSLGTAERPATFATAVDEGARTIKRATGAPRYEELAEVLTKRQEGAIRGVVADLAREGKFEQLAKAGGPKAREITGQLEPTLPASGMLNQGYSIARAIFNRLSGKLEGAALDRMSKAMETPQGALEVMKKAGVPSAQRSAVVEAMLRTSTIGAPSIMSAEQY
jgi:hypothetical protein